MSTIRTTAALLAFTISAPALAQQTGNRLGDHPAVIVKRLHAQQGYDYASKFYPHPAWLYLLAEAPRTMMDHPAVIVARQQREESRALVSANCATCSGIAPVITSKAAD